MWQVVLIFSETVLLSLLLHCIPQRIRDRGRNDHTVIMIRTAILFTFILSVIGFHKCLLRFKTISNFEMWGLTNKYPLLPILMASIHICILFTGPIVSCYYTSVLCKQSFFSALLSQFNYNYDVFIDLRNLLLAPLLEEILYRGSIMTFLLHSGYSLLQSILISSVAFGSCHFHHIFDAIHSGMPVQVAFFQCLFMFTYTTLFGILVSYVYVRTGSILAATAVHSISNFFSMPSFAFLQSSSPLYPYRKVLLSSLFFGIVGYLVTFKLFLNPQLLNSQFSSL
ncbi:hypothetical protein WA556_004038, partial [Blastocystis sp. ATCC 50177/Nand II]